MLRNNIFKPHTGKNSMGRSSGLSRRRGTLRSSRGGFRRQRFNLFDLQLLFCFALVAGMAVGVTFYLLYLLTFHDSAMTISEDAKLSLRKSRVDDHDEQVHDAQRLVDRLVREGHDREHLHLKRPEPLLEIPDHHDLLKNREFLKHHEMMLVDDTEKDDDVNKNFFVPTDGDYSKEIEKFRNHKVKIGTSGAFPHYPATPLVPRDHDFKSFKAQGGNRYEEYKHGDSPYSFSPGESDELARSRRHHVKNAMKHAWAGYEKYAFGKDELKPVSMTGSLNWGGLGTTLVDSLDTLWLMDMKEEFYRARDWCKKELTHDQNQFVSVFETTIRSLGGLLSAYDWSQDKVFLEQAEDLGKRLFQSFNKKSEIPSGEVNLHTGKGKKTHSTNIAEAGTLQLEFRALSRFSGIKEYKTRSENIFKVLNDLKGPDGLYPIKITTRSQGTSLNGQITFGAMADSFYEYMLKIWIQGGKTEDIYREMYDKSIQGMHDELLTVSQPSELVFIADKGYKMDYKMDHLVCFMGGLLALGAYTDPLGLESERAQRDLKTAKALTYTCYQMYARMPTGLSPEYIQFHNGEDFGPGVGGHHYLLRPEAVESFFVLYHLTGDPIYREWGWEVFQAIERYCKTAAGYGKVKNVRNLNRPPEDSMESFFLAETLKYLYLLFDPDTPIDLLHKHVFNTEAHPMRIFPAMDREGVPDLLRTAMYP